MLFLVLSIYVYLSYAHILISFILLIWPPHLHTLSPILLPHAFWTPEPLYVLSSLSVSMFMLRVSYPCNRFGITAPSSQHFTASSNARLESVLCEVLISVGAIQRDYQGLTANAYRCQSYILRALPRWYVSVVYSHHCLNKNKNYFTDIKILNICMLLIKSDGPNRRIHLNIRNDNGLLR